MPRLFHFKSNPAECMATIYDYGDGLVEGSWYPYPEFNNRYPEGKAARGESENREVNEEFAIRRAKTKARRLILTIKPSSLGTTTFRENVTDPIIAWKVQERFQRLVHEKFPNDKFIVFPELQKRGAFHFHFPIAGWMPKNKLKFYHKCWKRAARKLGGTFNISWHRRAGVSDKDNTVKICNYLLKYLTKQLGNAMRDLGGHRYRASKEIKPKRIRYLIDAQTIMEAAQELVALIAKHGGVTKYYFQSDGNNNAPIYGWACSWGAMKFDLPKPFT
jgi:hypothetical protein